ncbi:hypothetical protein [Verrucomicrobium sp. BvORR034]|uniref:hypothetical protein n=1 Tax=Verrucomicrobium sp. BvORR034 TaxID=1396418 RepID=UPI00067899D3|nr:hypothetical protein [Verrucomicrobium sp. BvORR034]
MFEGYKEGNGWQVMTEGYWYQRSDGRVRLWCSAIPAIGVAYTDFLRAKSDFETKHSLSLLDQLEDVTWAPNKAIEELQAQYVRGENRNLLDFARRSDRIAVSPDGSTVFVVRHHRAHGGPEGFSETNQPPEVGGTSTQVINVFSSSKGVQSWGKITLPRDAQVDLIHFEGEECHLRIRQSPTGKILAWNAPVQTIRRLQGIGILQRPMTDEALWKELEDSQRKGED